MIKNLTDEEFIVIVKNSNNISDICKKLGVVLQPGNYNLIKQEIDRLKLDTTHFTRKTVERKGRPEPWKLEDIFVKDSKYKSQANMKKKILKLNLLPYKCAICGCEPKWQGKDLVLILDHINGDHFDCRLQNMRFVCPNCNSQLDTNGGKNVKDRVEYFCKECGKKISKNSKNQICQECYWKHRRLQNKKNINRTSNIPEQQILQQQLQTMSYSQIGRYYGVTDNAVRRWCRKYGILLSKEQIKERQKQNLLNNIEKHKQQVTF